MSDKLEKQVTLQPAGNGGLIRVIEMFLQPHQKNTFRPFILVTFLMVVALLLRLWMAPLDGGVQYVTFFPAVAIAAVIGGVWPGLYAALLGLAMATYLFWPPYRALVFDFKPDMMLSNLVFFIDALVVSGSIEAMHRFHRHNLQANEELRLAASVFHNSAEGVIITDARSHILTVNPAFTGITGYEADEVRGRLPNLLRSNRHDPAFYRAMWQDLRDKGCWRGEIWNRRKDGEAFLEWLTINRIDDAKGKPIRYVGVFHDITELRQQDEHVRHMAFHDALTSLPNRLLLQDRLQHAMDRARRHDERIALAFIDLDRFKAVNDTLGHNVGDLLLQEIAGRIKRCLRASDTVARLGGDEFVILMEEQRDDAQIARLAKGIIDEISRPMLLDGHEVQVGASVGLACYSRDGEEWETLMRHADEAMYAAKSAGRNTFRFFHEIRPFSDLPN